MLIHKRKTKTTSEKEECSGGFSVLITSYSSELIHCAYIRKQSDSVYLNLIHFKLNNEYRITSLLLTI